MGKYIVGGGFTINNGRYTVPSTGVYYCTSTLRMDQATAGGYFRLSIVLQNGIDVNNGLSVIRGNRGSTNYEAGYYVCATQLRLQSTDTSSYFRLIISINNKNDVNAGLHVIEGNRGSTNYRAMRLAGTTYLKKGDRTAVSLYSQKDTYYFVQSESGFSCHKFVTPTKRC